jgi:outer membrane lipoprotein-sorting protein
MKKAVLLFSLILGLSAIGLRAQTAEDIIAKNIAATGGIEKIKALNSMKISGHAMAMGMEVPVNIFAKRPLMTRTEITFFGKTQLEVYDGTTAWQLNPFAPSGVIEPVELTGDQAKAIVDRADFDGDFVDYQSKGYAIEFMGKDEMEGSSVFKLKVTKKSGDVNIYFIDADNYLPIKVVSKVKVEGNVEEGEVVFGNYKPVAGVQIAHSMEIRSGGVTKFQIVIDKVEPNIPIDNSIFVMPKKK